MDSLESLFSLRGHRGLVTGASSGLGVECAKALAIGGADVALVARRKDRVVQIADDLAKAHGVKAIGIGADVTREHDLDRVMAEASAALGDLDILVVNLGEPPSLLRNDLSGNNNWLKVKLIGTKSNRSAIGARVLAHYGRKTQAQEVISQSSFYSVNDSRLHFGLGSETAVDLDIRWPSGLQQSLKGVAAGQIVVIKEGSGIVPVKTPKS